MTFLAAFPLSNHDWSVLGLWMNVFLFLVFVVLPLTAIGGLVSMFLDMLRNDEKREREKAEWQKAERKAKAERAAREARRRNRRDRTLGVTA